MVAVGIPVAAMVILMAVFSGFDELIRQMYRDFDPDFLVRPAEGKVFDVVALDAEKIGALEEVKGVSFVLEDSAVLEYYGRQTTATILGVDTLSAGAIVGQGIAYELGIRQGFTEQLKFYAPRRGSYSALLPLSSFSAAEAPVTGVFVLDAETDGEYVIVPLEFAQGLFDYEKRASGLAVRLETGAGEKRLKAEVANIAGEDFQVLTREEQKASMYRIMKLEKWGIFFIGLLVLLIASFSIVGSLIMLIIDKRAGIDTLEAMGASTGMVRSVFVRQGMMIGAIGALGGLVLGVLVCGAQQIFGLVPMPGGTFLIESYPVRMRIEDIAVICVAFVAVVWIITTFTVRATIKK